MLLAAFFIAWSSIAVLAMAVCAMAARGDRSQRMHLAAQRNRLASEPEALHRRDPNADGAQAARGMSAGPVAASPAGVDVDPANGQSPPPDPHPLELLLQDRRGSGQPLTGRAVR